MPSNQTGDRSARRDLRDGVIRVLVVDDHLMVGQGIALALGLQPDIEVVATVTSGRAALDALAALAGSPLSVVLMDYALGDGTGLEAATEIRAQSPSTAVLMISGTMDDLALLDAIEVGVSGLVPKAQSGEDLAAQVRRAAAGEMLVPPDVMQRLMRLRRHEERRGPADGPSLTPRESEVLALMARGLSNAGIAEALVISYHTVRGHVQAVLEKLEVGSRLEAVARGRALGLLDR